MGSCFGQACHVLSKLRIGTEKWVDAVRRSADKPRMEYCEDQNGTMLFVRAVQGHSHGVVINQTLRSLQQIL